MVALNSLTNYIFLGNIEQMNAEEQFSGHFDYILSRPKKIADFESVLSTAFGLMLLNINANYGTSTNLT